MGTYLGGREVDWATDLAIDGSGNTYVTGLTNSTDFPISDRPGSAYSGDFDAFLAKLNAYNVVEFSVLLGGSLFDRGLAVDIDSSGDIYVAGSTMSPDFPTTPEALDRVYGGQDFDVFVAKFRPDGSLIYSTYLGGSGRDVAWEMAIDPEGEVYLAGDTNSTDFPTTPGAFVVRRTDEEDGRDVFVTKLAANGVDVVYSSVFGGVSGDQAYSIALDDTGSAYLTGWTSSPDFPTTTDAFDATWNGFGDAFVLRLTPSGTAPIFSTFLGSTDREIVDCEGGSGIALDQAGDIYVTGTTCFDFPTTPATYDATPNGGRDAWLTKLDPSGHLLFSTLFGGSDDEEAVDLQLENSGRIVVAGYSRSDDFPTTVGAYDPTYNGRGDAFVARFESDGSRLNYSTYLGGGDTFLYGEEWWFPLGGGPPGPAWTCNGTNPLCGDIARAMALGPDGNLTVVGTTTSADFPATFGANDTMFNGFIDAFVTRMDLLPEPERPPVAVFDVTLPSDTEEQPRYGVFVDAEASADAETHWASLEVRWDWEDDGTWDTDWSVGKTARHEYGGPGRYTIRLEVRDAAGLTASATRQVPLAAPGPLLASATPSRGSAPLTVRFVVHQTGGVPPYSYEWTFGDGHRSTDASPVHTYEVGGTYEATLTARDSASRAMTWHQTIVVESLQGPTRDPVEAWPYAAAGAAVAISLGILFWHRSRTRRKTSPP